MFDGSSMDDTGTQPFRPSLMARPALVRVLAAALALVPLWLAVAWAVAVP